MLEDKEGVKSSPEAGKAISEEQEEAYKEIKFIRMLEGKEGVKSCPEAGKAISEEQDYQRLQKKHIYPTVDSSNSGFF